MPNAYLAMAKTLTLSTIVRRALSDARMGTATFSYSQLASTDAEAKQTLVELALEVENDLLDEFPGLNWATADVVVVSGEFTSGLPADLRDSDILGFRWKDGSMAGYPIQIISEAEAQILPREVMTGEATRDYPQWAVVQFEQWEGAPGIRWYPRPALDLTAEVVYRQALTPWATSALTSGGRTSAIPDRMLELFGAALAVELAERQWGGMSGDVAALEKKRGQLLTKWQRKLSGFPAKYMNDVMERGGSPRTQDQQVAWTYDAGESF